MNPATLVRDLTARGVRFAVNGDHLRVIDPGEVVTAELVEALKAAKPAVMAEIKAAEAVKRAVDPPAPDTSRDRLGRLATVAPDAAAGRIARESLIVRWLTENPVSSPPDQCAHCGKASEPGNIVPYGTGPHAWLHPRCWPAWDKVRRQQAAAALKGR